MEKDLKQLLNRKLLNDDLKLNFNENDMNLVDQRIYDFCKNNNLKNYIKTITKWVEHRVITQGLDYKFEILIKRNPYCLTSAEGIGFYRADAVAKLLNYDMESPNRILAFVKQALFDNSNGSTILKFEKVCSYIYNKLQINNINKIVKALLNSHQGREYDDIYQKYILLDNNFSIIQNDKNNIDITNVRYISLLEWYKAEKTFYSLCLNSNKINTLKIDDNQTKLIKIAMNNNYSYLNEDQKQVIKNIFNANINILTGCGGTGKTSVTRAILNILSVLGQTYTCLAPTGIASKVFSNLTGEKCSTIHRYYALKSKSYNGGIPRSCIKTDWVVLEECSMYSIEHLKLLNTMLENRNVRFLMIGDLNQLTPISAGSPFRDLFTLIKNRKIKGNIVELTKIMRASDDTYIPYICKQFTKFGNYNYSCENQKHEKVYFLPLEKDINGQIQNVIKYFKFDYQDTYILSPYNIGEHGTKCINDYIVNLYDNEILYQDNNKIYKKDCELMHIKNNAGLGIYNGERIKLIDKIRDEYNNFKYICKKLDDNTIIEYDVETLREETMLSYSVSVHKTQGITAKNVIFIASKKHYNMLNRNLVYTALSRASENLVIIYDKGILSMASKKIEIDDRLTFLGEFAKIKKILN